MKLELGVEPNTEIKLCHRRFLCQPDHPVMMERMRIELTIISSINLVGSEGVEPPLSPCKSEVATVKLTAH